MDNVMSRLGRPGQERRSTNLARHLTVVELRKAFTGLDRARRRYHTHIHVWSLASHTPTPVPPTSHTAGPRRATGTPELRSATP